MRDFMLSSLANAHCSSNHPNVWQNYDAEYEHSLASRFVSQQRLVLSIVVLQSHVNDAAELSHCEDHALSAKRNSEGTDQTPETQTAKSKRD